MEQTGPVGKNQLESSFSSLNSYTPFKMDSDTLNEWLGQRGDKWKASRTTSMEQRLKLLLLQKVSYFKWLSSQDVLKDHHASCPIRASSAQNKFLQML